MRVVVQRVSHARVVVDGEHVASIEAGLLALVGVEHRDQEDDARWIARKLIGLRVFEDDEGKMNRSVEEVGGSILVVSQFTLLGDCRKGRRPSFVDAASPVHAGPLVTLVADQIEAVGVDAPMGVFGSHMQVDLRNDGPVTLIIDSPG